jgi:hypothetical protein
MDGIQGHPGGLGDRGHRGRCIAALDEQVAGGVQDGAAGAPGLGLTAGGVVGAGLDVVGHGSSHTLIHPK